MRRVRSEKSRFTPPLGGFGRSVSRRGGGPCSPSCPASCRGPGGPRGTSRSLSDGELDPGDPGDPLAAALAVEAGPRGERVPRRPPLKDGDRSPTPVPLRALWYRRRRYHTAVAGGPVGDPEAGEEVLRFGPHNYKIGAAVGPTSEAMTSAALVVDTGAGPSILQQSAIPLEWLAAVEPDAAPI